MRAGTEPSVSACSMWWRIAAISVASGAVGLAFSIAASSSLRRVRNSRTLAASPSRRVPHWASARVPASNAER